MKVMDEKALMEWLDANRNSHEVDDGDIARLFKGRVLVDAEEWQRVQRAASVNAAAKQYAKEYNETFEEGFDDLAARLYEDQQTSERQMERDAAQAAAMLKSEND